MEALVLVFIVAIGLVVMSVLGIFGTEVFFQPRFCQDRWRRLKLNICRDMRLAFRFFERPPEQQSLLFLLLFGFGEKFPRFCVFVVAIGHVTMAVAVCRVCMVFSTVAMHFVMQLMLEVDSMIVVA